MKLAEGFGNDTLSGAGALSRLDMSEISNNVKLEYSYSDKILVLNSAAGNLSISDDAPLIDQINFGSGDDEYLIHQGTDMILTEQGGDNKFHYISTLGANVEFSKSGGANHFSAGGSDITFENNISEFEKPGINEAKY